MILTRGFMCHGLTKNTRIDRQKLKLNNIISQRLQLHCNNISVNILVVFFNNKTKSVTFGQQLDRCFRNAMDHRDNGWVFMQISRTKSDKHVLCCTPPETNTRAHRSSLWGTPELVIFRSPLRFSIHNLHAPDLRGHTRNKHHCQKPLCLAAELANRELHWTT